MHLENLHLNATLLVIFDPQNIESVCKLLTSRFTPSSCSHRKGIFIAEKLFLKCRDYCYCDAFILCLTLTKKIIQSRTTVGSRNKEKFKNHSNKAWSIARVEDFY